jgi:ribonuclease P protein component
VDSRVSDTPQGRFPKSTHLLKHSDFQRVYQQGRRHFSGNMTVFYLRTGDLPAEAIAVAGNTAAEKMVAAEQRAAGGQSAAAEAAAASRIAQWASLPPRERHGVRVGLTVSKSLGGAVDRNRMRRRTREAVRHHLFLLKDMNAGVDMVINPKKTLLQAEFTQISREIERAFKVVRRLCEGGSGSGASSTSQEARPR